MTNQKTFNIVVAHLRKQGPARDCSTDCRIGTPRYRTKKGKKCAAGVLIPDTRYSRLHEGTLCDAGPVKDILLQEGHDPAFVRRLQYIHDYSPVKIWETEWAKVAKVYGLTVPRKLPNGG